MASLLSAWATSPATGARTYLGRSRNRRTASPCGPCAGWGNPSRPPAIEQVVHGKKGDDGTAYCSNNSNVKSSLAGMSVPMVASVGVEVERVTAWVLGKLSASH